MLYTLFALGIIYVLGKMLRGPNKRQPKMSTRAKEAAGNRRAAATTKTRATTAKKPASKKPASHRKPAAHRKDTEPPPPKQPRQEEEVQDPLPDLDQRVAASVLKTLQHAGLIPTDQTSEGNEEDLQVEHEQSSPLGDLPTVSPFDQSTTPFCQRVDDTPHMPEAIFMGPSVPLMGRVDPKIAAKIAAGEYIDFSSLIQDPAKKKYALAMTDASIGTEVVLAPAKQRLVNTIERWLDAFEIFASHESKFRPACAPALFKYQNTVRDLAMRGGNWKYFDENFRWMKAHNPSQSWDALPHELWLKAMHTAKNSTNTTNSQNTSKGSYSKKGKKHSFKSGMCFSYHKGNSCDGCDYDHTCHVCHKIHPAYQCLTKSNKKQDKAKSQQ